MSASPKQPIVVSVLTASYNHEAFIAGCIESVLNQKLVSTAGQPILVEHIIVDDQSTDRSFEIAEAYAKKYPDRIRVLKNTQNMGQEASRNRALAEARGSIVGLLDSDDLYLPNKCSDLIDAFDDPSVQLVFGQVAEIDDAVLRANAYAASFLDSEGLVRLMDSAPTRLWPNIQDYPAVAEFNAKPASVLGHLLERNAIGAGACLFRRVPAVVFDGRYRNIGEYPVWIRLATLGRVHFVSKPVSVWRKHAFNLGRQKALLAEQELVDYLRRLKTEAVGRGGAFGEVIDRALAVRLYELNVEYLRLKWKRPLAPISWSVLKTPPVAQTFQQCGAVWSDRQGETSLAFFRRLKMCAAYVLGGVTATLEQMGSVLLGPLLLGLITSVILYIYFFLCQEPTLGFMDDYVTILELRVANVWQWAADVYSGLLKGGRFRPVDIYLRAVVFKVFGTSPFWLHVAYFLRASIFLYITNLLLKKYSFSRFERWLSVFFILSSLVFKFWLFYLTAAETWALIFFFAALLFVENAWLAVPLFLLSCASKETFFVGGVILVGLRYAHLLAHSRHRGLQALTSFFKSSVPIIAAMLLFLGILWLLPRAYAARMFSLGAIFNFGFVQKFIVGFTLPVLKNFGPWLVFLPFGLWAACRTSVLVSGFCIFIIIYTFLMAMWGPFDSWIYLHLPIAAAWGVVMAKVVGVSVTRPLASRHSWLLVGFVLLGLVYSVASVWNGARNLTQFHQEGLTAVRSARERVCNGAPIASNCEEAMVQLVALLKLESGCSRSTPPKVQVDFNAWPQPARGLYFYSPKCGVVENVPFDWMAPSSKSLFLGRFWSVVDFAEGQ